MGNTFQFHKRHLNFLLFSIFFLMGFTITDAENSIRSLRSEDADAKRHAADSLIHMGAVSVKPLIAILKEQDASIRKEAAFILGAIGEPQAIKPLSRSLGDEDADVRMAATWALVRIGPPAVSSLVSKLGAKNREIVLGAKIALEKIGTPAVPGLIESLKNRDADVRRNAVRVLGNIGDSACVGALKKAIKDKDEAVREEASISLEKISKHK